jgi:hypothetical protein
MAAGVNDTHRFDGDARTARIKQSPGVRDMQQVRISEGHHSARARRHQEGEQVLHSIRATPTSSEPSIYRWQPAPGPASRAESPRHDVDAQPDSALLANWKPPRGRPAEAALNRHGISPFDAAANRSCGVRVPA